MHNVLFYILSSTETSSKRTNAISKMKLLDWLSSYFKLMFISELYWKY